MLSRNNLECIPWALSGKIDFMLASYFRLFINIILLRATPQDVPASRVLLWMSVFFLFVAGFIEGVMVFEPFKNLVFNIFDISLLLICLYLVLVYTNNKQRFLQTAIAACGVFILFRFLEFPAYWLLVADVLNKGDPILSFASLYIFLLLIYSIFVLGHIVRHALASNITIGVLLALVYFVANVYIIDLVFPRSA